MTIKTRIHLKKADRKRQIIKVAINLSLEFGYTNFTVRQLAERAGIRHGLVYNYFESMDAVRAQVMKTAIKEGVLNIVLQGLCLSDPVALKAPAAVKRKARKHI